MYESSHNDLSTPRHRQHRVRRRTARRKRILIGAAVVVCLLTCAVQALGNSPTLIPDNTSIEQPKIIQNAAFIIPPPEVTAPSAAPSTPITAENEWQLLLVNPWNTLPEDFEISLTQLKNGHSVDERCYPYLQKMMDDCRAAGLKPVICSSYRTQEKQEQLFHHQVNQYIAKGYLAADARVEAGKSVAVPGTSEHQLGLAVDIVDLLNQNLNESQEETEVQKWLMENSWKYGFILRYPNDKSDITGIIYEPWHYRYVGKDAAREIYEQKICLEEYLAQREESA